MHKLLATIKKEFLILLRDKIGLSILFIMPIFIIIIMTVIQDAAFRTINEKGVELILVDEDKDDLGLSIREGLESSNLVELHTELDGKELTRKSATEAIRKGKFLIGVVIPKNATKAIQNNVHDLIATTFDDGTTASNQSDSIEITILIDPIVKNTIVETVSSKLREFISGIKTKVMFDSFSKELASIMPEGTKQPKNTYEQTQFIQYNKEYTNSFGKQRIPSSEQHNVPAWTIFSMFFIVIAVVANMINEKKEGSIFRLNTVPSPYSTLILGKGITFVVVCCLQFILMLLVGIYLLPVFGLESLEIGTNYFGIVLLAFCTALSAAGFGIMVGTLAKSQQQGAILGSLFVILLSALGGVWVPTYVMPETIRNICAFSPMNWSLTGFYDLYLRGASTTAILWNCTKLVLFFVLMIGISIRTQRKFRTE